MRILTIVTIILFLIFAGLFIYKTFFLANYKPSTLETPVVNAEDNLIKVNTQRPGSVIVINRVVLTRKGYAVIYNNIDGRPGDIIGNTKILPIGESNNIAVGLVHPAVEGDSYFAILHEDSGDGFFTPNIDIPITDEYGNIISIRFGVDKNARPVN